MNLTAKLTAIFILLSIVPLSLVGYMDYTDGRQAIEQGVIDRLQTTTLLKEAEFVQWLGDGASDIRALAQRPLVRVYAAVLTSHNPTDSEYQTAYDLIRQDHFLPRLEYYINFLDFSLLRASDGLVMVSSDAQLEGKYRETEAFFIEGQQDTYIGDVSYEVTRGEQTMHISTPVTDENGTVIAVLAGNLNLADISAIMTRRSGLRETEETYLVNFFNLMVTESPFEPDSSLRRAVYTDGVNDCLTHQNGSSFYNDYRGVPVIGAYRWMPERNLCIVTEMDQSEALAPIVGLRNATLLIGLVVGLVVTVLGVFFARTMTGPIHRLVEGATEIGVGNLDYRIGTAGQDEIGQLARAFDHMAKTLKTTTVSRDELEQRIAERTAQLAESNKDLEAFSYSVSHDLRAPLRAMDGFSRILLDDYAATLPDEAQRYLGLVRDNAQQMGNLIDHLLAFSRLGRKPMSKEPVLPGELVKSILVDSSTELDGRNIKITIGDLPPCQADPALLRQVFANLLGNAVKFTQTCDLATIEIGHRNQDGESVYFVKDNGVGFDIQYADKLFGVFQRLHRSEEFEGTGVGLATVQRIIHRHGGRIWTEAEVSKGATFYFTLMRRRQ